MNQRYLKRLLATPLTLLWMPTASVALQTVRTTTTKHPRLCSTSASVNDANNADDTIDNDWNSDAYWMRQIHKQGEERPEYQWFRERSSLPFECTACGKCCKTKGQVYMTPDEHTQAAELLDISKEDFIQQYASHTLIDEHAGELWIRLRDQSSTSSTDHGCIFLQEDNTCRIYEARPIQCSTYPFWPNILASPQAWNKEVRRGDDADRTDLPPWTLEGGGCEGMKLLSEADDDDDGGVPREQVYEQAHWYEHDERRFPRGKETTVNRNEN